MVAPFVFSGSCGDGRLGRPAEQSSAVFLGSGNEGCQTSVKYWEKFKTFKERGEWVELQFMAAAAQHRFAVSKPWGDTKAYDVGIEHKGNYLRVQVKSTTMRSGAGYLCQFHPNHNRKCDYSLKEIDVFAAYVIPENVWYLIPAALLLGKHRKWIAMLCPLATPKKKACYC